VLAQHAQQGRIDTGLCPLSGSRDRGYWTKVQRPCFEFSEAIFFGIEKIASSVATLRQS
jgi:hypothetical protein